MLKYCLRVFDESGKQIVQVITDELFETICELSKLGNVKGFILDDKDCEVEK